MIIDPTNSLGLSVGPLVDGVYWNFADDRAVVHRPITREDLERVASKVPPGGFVAVGPNDPDPPMTDSEREEAKAALVLRLSPYQIP